MPHERKENAPEVILDQALVGLSRLGIPLQSDDLITVPVTPVKGLALQSRGRSFRDELMDEILEERPGLTREELSRQMDNMGF
ncbi:MAG: hypothetical protein RL572_1829 [Pseudomonadota bacterium]|jgi:hypothetical protein